MRSSSRYGFLGIVALLLLAVLTAGVQGSSYVSDPSISSDGRYVTFDSESPNLVPGDTNGERDIFVRDRTAGVTYRISKSTAGVQGNDSSASPSISSDGRYVTFYSAATNLVDGDTNAATDVFVRDRQTGTTTRISKSSAGVQGNGGSFPSSISADGRYVTFASMASNLVAGDANAVSDIFVRDRQTGTTTRVSTSTGGIRGSGDSYRPAISSFGRCVTFYSYAANLVAGDTNAVSDIFVRDRQTGTTTRVSKSTAGVQGNGSSSLPSLSSDGRYVAFGSFASNLVTGDTNGMKDIFVRDRQAGKTTLISRSSGSVLGDEDSYYPSISSDGRYVVFESLATNLVAGDTNAEADIFVRDRQTGTTTRVSKSSGGVQGNGGSFDSTISANGRYVAFGSDATNLVAGDTNGREDIFIRDRQTGITTLVSKS